MGNGGTQDRAGVDIARLRKADVEQLLDGYDADPIGALTIALQRVLDLPAAGWAALLVAAPLDIERRAALHSGDQAALDQLLRELNELRVLP